MEKEYDPVNRPAHYTSGEIECIDAMIAAKGYGAVRDFCELNALKYIWRSNLKSDSIQDLKKAQWYISKDIEIREHLRALQQQAEEDMQKEMVDNELYSKHKVVKR